VESFLLYIEIRSGKTMQLVTNIILQAKTKQKLDNLYIQFILFEKSRNLKGNQLQIDRKYPFE